MLHPRAFKVTVIWTLLLLGLGSVVHATESSLACPDWPTCFGTLAPEMTGGVFWEHLHRLVASGLGLMFALATWLAWRETRADRPWIFRWCVAGMVLIVVQGVFGGLTVLYRLPDLVSTTHWTLALLFLALAAVLAAATTSGGRWASGSAAIDRRVAAGAAAAAVLVFAQSVLGAYVRHSDAGLACLDIPLCLGQLVPPLVNTQITVHFLHRALAVVTAVAVLGLAAWAVRVRAAESVRRWLAAAAFLVVTQVALGIASILTVLAVTPVSLHSLVAALLLVALVHAAVRARPGPEGGPAAAPGARTEPAHAGAR